MLRTALLASAVVCAAAGGYHQITDSLATPAAVNASGAFDVAGTSSGGFVMVWAEANAPYTVHVQRHDSQCVQLDVPALDVSQGAAVQGVAVAELTDGGFVVVSTTPNVTGSVTTARVYSDSAALVAQVVVSDASPVSTRNADVAALSYGKFTIVWEEQAAAGSDWSVFVQTYKSDGTPDGNTHEVRAASAAESRNYYPSITDTGSSFVVSWAEDDNVYTRTGSASGVGSASAVDSAGTTEAMYSRVADRRPNWFTDSVAVTYTTKKSTTDYDYYQLIARVVANDDKYYISESRTTALYNNDVSGFKASGEYGMIAVYATTTGVRGMTWNFWGGIDDVFIIAKNYDIAEGTVRVVDLSTDFECAVVYLTEVSGTTQLVVTRLQDPAFTAYSVHL